MSVQPNLFRLICAILQLFWIMLHGLTIRALRNIINITKKTNQDLVWPAGTKSIKLRGLCSLTIDVSVWFQRIRICALQRNIHISVIFRWYNSISILILLLFFSPATTHLTVNKCFLHDTDLILRRDSDEVIGFYSRNISLWSRRVAISRCNTKVQRIIMHHCTCPSL